MKMISRFSLYGFLKNQQFYDPFFILYFLSLGLNFFQIGLLVSFRSICTNLLEVPSGALADLYGRKNVMLLSLFSYIISFILYFLSMEIVLLFTATFFFSIGAAFRSGTHKAIIFDWLRQNDRLAEKTKIYGYTRSWSKVGSAVSVIISVIIVIFSKNYKLIFLLTTVPYLLGIWNILSYPPELNSKIENGSASVKIIYAHLKETLKNIMKSRNLKKLILQSSIFEGTFNVSKDYLQPIIKSQALVLSAFLFFSERINTAIIIGVVYFILYMVSATAARTSHRVVEKTGSEEQAVLFVTYLAFVITAISCVGLYFEIYSIPIICFIIYYILQNIWRPVLVSQYDDFSDKDEQATILSIESQSKTLGVFLFAPVAGFIADNYGIYLTLGLVSVLILLMGIFSRIYASDRRVGV